MANENVKGYFSSNIIDLNPKFSKNTVLSSYNIDLTSYGPPEKKPRILYELTNRQKSICNKSRQLKRHADENLRLDQVPLTTDITNKMSYENFPKRFARENRRGMPSWRGVRGRTRWNAPPVIQSQVRPLMQRPMPQGPRNNRAPPGNPRAQFPAKVQNFDSTNSFTNLVSSSDRVVNYSCHRVKNPPLMQKPDNISNSSDKVNINELLPKLIASGILSTTGSLSTEKIQPASFRNNERATVSNKQVKKNQLLELVSFSKPEQLKVRQAALYERLYRGMQCSNCGMRFLPKQSMQYSQHLDWHFRQNHKRKQNSRVACNRKWYYSLGDWKKYAEIENPEEREKSYFELQQEAESAAKRSTATADLPSVRADPKLLGKGNCEVCGDKLEIFFHDDKEEWHFKNSLRFEDKFYHPICFEEHQNFISTPLENSKLRAHKCCDEPLCHKTQTKKQHKCYKKHKKWKCMRLEV